jgi:mono/diheme cytochrome c family protein
MKKGLVLLGTLLAVGLVFFIAAPAPLGAAPVVQSEGSGSGMDGKAVFDAQRCSMCHAVEKAGIEAKTKAAAMKGPDLSGYEGDAAAVIPYLKGDTEMNGAKHKKKATGSDAELQAMLDWLGSLK